MLTRVKKTVVQLTTNGYIYYFWDCKEHADILKIERSSRQGDPDGSAWQHEENL